jgi:hypothetical protein
LAAAVVEADAAKAAGARIIAVGIGNRQLADNLEAIASSSDDVYTSDFENLGQTLTDIAIELCGGTITVRKLIDADGNLATTDDQTPAEGWLFTPEIVSGSATPASAETDAEGSIVFGVGPDGTLVDLVEVVSKGYVLLDASCDGATENGLSNLKDAVTGIVVGVEERIVCTFINALESVT